MKILRNLLLIFAVTVCFSATAFAQQDKPPPKPKPPQIPVEPNKKPPERPKDGKKPNSTVLYLREEN